MDVYKSIIKIISRCIFRFCYKIIVLLCKQDQILLIYSKSSSNFSNLDVLSAALKLKKVQFNSTSSQISIKNLVLIAKAKVICVDQSTTITSNIALSKTTKLIQIWHAGGAFKKVGFDAWNGKKSDFRRISRIHGNTSFFIVSDNKLRYIYSQAFKVPVENIFPYGIPRTDEYYKSTKIPSLISKIVLLAPTFRTDRCRKRYFPISLKEINLLKKILGSAGYQLVIRAHPSIRLDSIPDSLNWSEKSLADCIRNCSILITDYSSIIFDYSLFPGKIFFYLKDEVEYASERGTYFNPFILFPDYCAKSIDELGRKILSSKSNNTGLIKQNFMRSSDGSSSFRVIELISTILKKRRK